jgi:NhaP-type Na+/H+ or K+/H+ antiporter
MRLRIAHHGTAMVAAQVVGTAAVFGLSVAAVSHGTTLVAAALGVGYLVGGLVGYLISRFMAPIRDLPGKADTSAEVAVSVS